MAKRPTANELSELGIESFESRRDCERRQAQMIKSFSLAVWQLPELAALARCKPDYCSCDPCREACHHGTRNRRVNQIQTAVSILKDHPGPFFDVSIVHPLWEQRVGNLGQSRIDAANQWLYRRLALLDRPELLAIGSYEVSLNREVDGETYWAAEIHCVVAGATKRQLRSALEIESRYRNRRPGARLLVITKVDDLPRRLAYSLKRFVEERRAYIASNGRQHRRHLPLKRKELLEHDAWLLSLPLGARTFAVGCRRRGCKFFPKKSAEGVRGRN